MSKSNCELERALYRVHQEHTKTTKKVDNFCSGSRLHFFDERVRCLGRMVVCA